MRISKFVDINQKNLEITLKIMEKCPGNLLKNLEKSWKSHGILSVQKSGNPVLPFNHIIILSVPNCI